MVICSVLLLAWGVLRLYSRRSARRLSARRADWRELVRRYPKTERAIGYLEGLSAAAGWGISTED